MNNNTGNTDFNNINNSQYNNMNQQPNNNEYYNPTNEYNHNYNGMNNGYNNDYNNMNNGYYTDYNNMPYYKKPLSHYIKRFLIGFLCAALFIFLLLWLFPTKANLNESLNSALNPFYDRIFQENLNTMKEVAIGYFTTDRLPKKEGDTKKLTLGEMLEMKLLLEIKDKNGNMCDTDESYVELTRLEDEYKMKVNLKCGEEEDYIIVYLGCYDYCLNDICEKQESTKSTAASGSSGGKVSSFLKTFKKTINKTVDKVTEIIVPDKPDNPTPEDTVYKYLYRKTVTIHHDTEYSNWTEWSDDIEYDPNNNNINWGTHETSIYEKNGSKTIKRTLQVVDKDNPIYQNKQVYIGSYSRYACAGYDYFINTTTNTTYKVTSGWVDKGIITTSKIPSSTDSVKYEYVGMDFDNCGDICDISPSYKFRKYVRNISTTNQVSTSSSSLSAVCTKVVKTDIPVYANVNEFVAYGKKLVTETETVYYYHYKTREIIKKAYDETKTYEQWSYSKNDQTLINQGYKYTGIYKKVD